MADVISLREAVAELVGDGDAIALEGFTHLIPTAGAHEIIRQADEMMYSVKNSTRDNVGVAQFGMLT